MCGRLNVIDDPGVWELCQRLGIDLNQRPYIQNRFVRATDRVSVIRDKGQGRYLDDATWWLLLDRTEQGFKPSRYTSFNTRYDKLNTPRSAGFKAFRESRCIIPAKGFGETEFVNKKPVHYHDMQALDGQALALGGLCREWFHPATGEVALSCSVITLPPHPKLASIHTKAMPLILPQHDDTMAMWLDPTFTNTSAFDSLLTPHLPQPLLAQQINKPSQYQAVGDSFVIDKD